MFVCISHQAWLSILGPHSVAKCDVQPIDTGDDRSYKVTYVPVETGIYNVYVKWNGKDTEGLYTDSQF